LLKWSGPKGLYLIPVVSKALDILELLQKERASIPGDDLSAQPYIQDHDHRILKTFVYRGHVARTEDGLYRFVARPKKARFGFGSESAEMPFSQEVTDSLRTAAAAAGVDLLVLDNR